MNANQKTKTGRSGRHGRFAAILHRARTVMQWMGHRAVADTGSADGGAQPCNQFPAVAEHRRPSANSHPLNQPLFVRRWPLSPPPPPPPPPPQKMVGKSAMRRLMAMLSRVAGYTIGTLSSLPESACPESISPTVRRLCHSLFLPILLIGLPTQVAAQMAAGVTLSSSSLIVAEDGGTGSYTVVLNTRPDGDVTITATPDSVGVLTVNVAGGTATLTFTSTNWDQPQTVIVVGMNRNTATIEHRITTGDGNAYTSGLALDGVLATVVDDEAGVTFSPSTVVVREGGTATYTAVLDTQPAGDVVITLESDMPGLATVNIAGGTAGASQVLTFTNGNWRQSQRVTVAAISDGIENTGDVRLLTVSHAITTGDSAAYQASRLALQDVVVAVINDQVPAVTIAADSGVGVTEGSPADFIITADPAPDRDLTIRLTVEETGDATGFLSDSAAGAHTVMLPVGQTTMRYTVPTQDDTIDEPDGAVSVTVTDGDDYGPGASADTIATVSVWDNERTAFTMTHSRPHDEDVFLFAAITESGADNFLDITVTLDQPLLAGQQAIIPYTAGETAHYTLVLNEDEANTGVTLLKSGDHPVGRGRLATIDGQRGGLLRFAGAGARQAVLRLTAIDNTDRMERSFAFTFAESSQLAHGFIDNAAFGLGSGGAVFAQIVQLSILDDDATTTGSPTITFALDNFQVAEDDGPAQPVVWLSRPLPDLVEVPVQISDGTAIAGQDYEITQNRLLFPPGVTGANVRIRLIEDNIAEPTETLTIAFGELPDSLAAGASPAATISIFDVGDTAGLRLGPAPFTVPEGSQADYTVVLTSEPTAAVTVTISGHDGTDLMLDKDSLTFASEAWNTPQAVTVSAMADSGNYEGTLTHTITSIDSTYAELEAVVFDVTVTDTDAAGVLISESTATVAENSGMDDYTVHLNTRPGGIVTLDITAAAGVTVAPPQLLFTSTNWQQVQTVTITGVDDDIDNTGDQRTAVIRHTISATEDSTGYPTTLTIDSVTVTVTDDDTAGITFNPITVTLAESGGTAAYTVVLDSPPADNVIIEARAAMPGVTLHRSGDSPAGTAVLEFIAGNWNQPQTVIITGVDDDTTDTRTVLIRHFVTNGAAGYATGQRVDDVIEVTVLDVPPAISIAGGSRVTEGDMIEYTLTANKPPATDLTINLTISEDETDGQNFVAAGDENSQAVTFPAGTTAASYTIPITDDEVDEARGEVTVTINDGTGYTAGTDTVTITVRDDDRTIVTLAENPAGDLDEGARKQITLTLNRPLVSGETQVLSLELGGTATVNTDYTLAGIPADGVSYEDLASGNPGIVFTGQTSGSATTATLTVTAIADGISDPGEVITMEFATSELVSPDGDAGIQDARGGGPVSTTRTIAFRINEQPALVLNPSMLTIDESDTATYTVSLVTQPNAPVAITVSGQAGTDLTLSDDTLNFTTQNWNQPQTITVTAGSDDDAQSDDPIALLHTATGGNYAGVTGEVTVTITEDDTAGITVQPTTLAVDEGGTNNYTVVLTSAPAGEVIITVDPDTVATVNNDMLTFTQSNWNQAQTVTVIGMDDAVHNAGDARSGTITHAISQGDSGDYPTDRELDLVQLTVADNDDPTLSVQVVGDHTSIEEGGARMIQITVSPDTGESFMLIDVRPLLRISDGYELTLVQTDTSLDPTLQFEVSVTDNDQDGADGMLTIDVSSVTGYAAGSPAMVQLTVNDNDQADILITGTGSVTRVAENGGTDSYRVVLTSQPTASVTVTAAPGTGITMTDTTLTFTSTDWNQPQTLIVTGQDNNDDDASDRRVAISHTLSGDSQYSGLSIDDLMVMVDDDDPTEVSLTRTGSTGAIDEGQAVTFTVELGRALIAGEIIEVPLSIAGTDVEPADWSLALQSGTGVVLSNENTMTPLLRFENAGAQTAELTLTAIGDNTMEGSGSETFIIALGPDGTVTNGFDHSSLNTNVGGGADPDSPDHFSVQVNDAIVMPMITITGGATVTEGMGSASFTLTATPAPTDALTLMLNVTGGSDFIATSGAQTVALNSGSSTVTYLIATQGDAVDEPNGTVTVTVGTGTGYEVGDPSVASVGVHDDDATTVTLVGDPGNVAEGGSKQLTLTLGRALTAGEQLTVPLTFGGTATFGTDYTLTGTTANGVDYSDLSGGSVIFSAGGEVATLTLMAQTDAVAETGGETVRIALGTLDSNSGTNLGGGASGTGNVDFTIQEQPAIVLTPTRLTLIEGDSASYRVSLAAAPSADVMVTLTGTNAELEADDTTLTFTSQNWGNPQTVTLTAVTDSNTVTDQVTLTHSADAGYDSVTADLEVIITDSSPQLQFSSTEIELDEGGSTSYTVRLSARPIAEVTVMLSGHADTSLTVNPLALTFSTMNWNETQVITLTAGTDSNSVNEAAVTLVHAADAGFGEVSRDVTVTITDTDTPDSTGDLVLSESRLNMKENDTASYTVVLDTRPSGDVTVRVSSGDATRLRVTGGGSLLFTLTNWNRAQTVTVMARDDADSGANRVILTHTADAGYDPVTLPVEIADESADMTAMQAAQQMWLPRFGLTAVEHMLGGLDYRFSASSQPGLSGNLNGLPRGQSFNAAHLLSSRGSPDASAMGIEQLGAGSSDRPRKLSRTLSLPKLLPSLLHGSHFTFTDQDGTSIWGQAAYTKYKDGEEAGTSIDGEVTTAMLGIDRDNGQTLMGLALAYSDSDGEWQGASASDEGKQSGMLVSMLPYLRYDLSERLQLWGAASYGRGDLKQTQTSQTGVESKHNLVQLSATAGLRGTLLERPVEEGGLTLELISGLTLARIEADDSRVMAGTEADTQRFRMGLAWSWQLPEEDGVRLTPELELGLRYDGGDTSEGFGLELGGGLSWQTLAKGLTVDVRGRYLLEHEAAEREEWGLSGSLRYEAWPNSAYGPSFSLRHEYGNAPAASGLDRLLSDSLTDALEEEDNRHTAAVSSRWTLKGEWGFALTDDATGIPYASLSASDAKRDLTLGWRLLSNPAGLKSKLDIKAIRREQDDNNPRHSVGAEWKLNW